MDLRRGVDAHRTEDTRQAEHVLRLEERAVRVAIHLHGNHVLTHVGIAGDVEAGSVARVLRETHVLAVHPEVEERIYAVELHEQLLALPCLRHVERAAVGAHLVAVFVGGPVRRRRAHHALAPVVFLHLVVEDDGLVHVDGGAVLLASVLLQAHEVPTRRYADVVPSRAVVAQLEEVGRPLVGRLGEVELPRAVEAQPATAVLGQHAPCLLSRGKRREAGPRLQFVVAQPLGALPLCAVGRRSLTILKPFQIL